jgi:hypothetical protein
MPDGTTIGTGDRDGVTTDTIGATGTILGTVGIMTLGATTLGTTTDGVTDITTTTIITATIILTTIITITQITTGLVQIITEMIYTTDEENLPNSATITEITPGGHIHGGRRPE